MAAGAVAETVATELEQVAGDLEQVASATRRLDGRVLGSLGIGLGIGAAVGFYFGYRYSKKKLRSEIYAEAEKDIETIREHYQKKLIAIDNLDKAPVEDLIKERGYRSEEDILLRGENPESDSESHFERLEAAEVEEVPEPQSIRHNVFEEKRSSERAPQLRMSNAMKDKDDDWDWKTEYEIRADADDQIYVLHQDEFEENNDGFSQATYIYYTQDDILVDEDDLKTILSNEENLIGSRALQKFGHGADDYNTVYVRNSRLEMEMAIHRVNASWEEEILGLDPHESG